MKCVHGFSLIELLTVLSIVAILSAMSLTGFSIFWHKAASDTLSSELVRTIQLARSEAIARHEKIILCGSVDHITCSDEWNHGYLIKTADRVIYHFSLNSEEGQLHWRSYPDPQTQLEFLASGFLNLDNGTFWFCAKKALKPVWAVVLNQSTRVRMVYPDEDGNVRVDQGKPLLCFDKR